MKKNSTMRVAALLIALTLITCCFVGGTFAKYVSTASGSDNVTVAKWEITVNETDITEADTVTFNLFETINDTGNSADEEEDVANEKIAPGTAGSFKLVIKNDSEVNAKYTIELEEANSNVPLQYSVDGNTWVDSIDELVMDALTNQVIAMGDTKIQTVQWKWGFEGGHVGQTDATDTALGIAAQTTPAEVIITADITATQVD